MTTTSPDAPSLGPTGDLNADPAVEKAAFIPLEANPVVMNSLLHRLGVSSALAIHDVLSLHEPELLAFVPRPALALLLVFPVSATYESHRLAEDALTEEYTGKGEGEPVLWFKQTIRNACGLMGLLHAAGNGEARGFIEADTPLDKLLKQAIPFSPRERSLLIESSSDLANAHAIAASQGATAAPDSRDDVDLHYVCFVKTSDASSSRAEGTLWELDGRRKGPIARGKLGSDEDVLSQKALTLGPLKFLEREGTDLRFSCVALAGSLD